MSFQYPPIIILFAIGMVISWFIGWKAWQMRPARGAEHLAYTMIFASLWALGPALQAMATTVEFAYWAINIQYLGVMAVVYFWGTYTIGYSTYDRWLTRRTYIAMAIGPILFYVIMFTSRWHGGFHSPTGIIEYGRYEHINFEVHGLFWLWVVYGYAVVIGGSALLAASVLRHPNLYRGQITMLLLGVATPTLMNILFVIIDLEIIGPHDPTSIGYIMTGILFLLAMTRYRIFDVQPVAHDLVFRGVQSGVILIDMENHVMDMNPAAEEILNKKNNDAVGKTMLDAFPEQQDLILRFRDVQNTRTEITSQGQHYELQLMPLTNRRGKLAGRIIMLYDITERKQALIELDAYAHTVAHDLKNPIGIIKGYARQLEMAHQQMDDAKIERYLATINRNAEKTVSIIDNLLLLSSVRDQDMVEMKVIDMGQVFMDAIARLDPHIEATQATVIPPSNWIHGKGYAPWVEEIWVNYLSNALKYGGSPPVVEVGSTALTNGNIRYWVKDNGQPLQEADRNRLFTEFTRLEQHASIDGHGLGLSIVQRIVSKLGGEVGVEKNTDSDGNLFYFTLPTLD